MKIKNGKPQLGAALLSHELDVLSEEMARAMHTAYVPYIVESGGKMTLKMEAIWARYIDWAKRAEKAGF